MRKNCCSDSLNFFQVNENTFKLRISGCENSLNEKSALGQILVLTNEVVVQLEFTEVEVSNFFFIIFSFDIITLKYRYEKT